MMVAVNDGSAVQYLLTDHLGSTVAVTDSSGTLTSQQRYLPFGGERAIPNSPILATDFGYTGQRLLDSGMGGIMDYKARFYSPMLGRFLQPDSIIPNPANPQDYNRFGYVRNNPINFNDPTGHFTDNQIMKWTDYGTKAALAKLKKQNYRLYTFLRSANFGDNVWGFYKDKKPNHLGTVNLVGNHIFIGNQSLNDFSSQMSSGMSIFATRTIGDATTNYVVYNEGYEYASDYGSNYGSQDPQIVYEEERVVGGVEQCFEWSCRAGLVAGGLVALLGLNPLGSLLVGTGAGELASNLPMPPGSQKGDVVLTYYYFDTATGITSVKTTIIRNGNVIQTTITEVQPNSTPSDLVWP